MSLATIDSVEQLSWTDFLDSFEWSQGQHLTCIAPTEAGKTTLVRELLRKADEDGTHPWQAIIATKTLDEVLDTFEPDGFITMPTWMVSEPDVFRKVMIHPKLRSLEKEDKAEQQTELRRTLNAIYKQHGWLLYLDELKHVAAALGLKDHVEMLWHQGRSAGITVVAAVQRPRHVPLMAYDQSQHLFFWANNDHDIRKRLSEIGGKANPDDIVEAVSDLADHEFLYVQPLTGRMVRSKVEI